jgi:hypothetical protein
MNDYNKFLADVNKFKQYEVEASNRIKANVDIIEYIDDSR